MTTAEMSQLQDPDLYASELQHWLMIAGPRSKPVRDLMRVARRHPEAELERIFETKLAEFKRAHREDRKPTLLNLPVRIVEWLTENAKFTPPRDVLMTLVYVVLVLVLFEGVKGIVPVRNLMASWGEHGRSSSLQSPWADSDDEEFLTPRETSLVKHPPINANWLPRNGDVAPPPERSRIELEAALRAVLASDEFRERLVSAVRDALGEQQTTTANVQPRITVPKGDLR